MKDYPDLMLIGKMGAGKSSGAKFLEELGFEKISIAGYHKGGIRDVARRIDPRYENDRAFLNWLGTVPDQEVWLRNLLDYWHSHDGKRPVVCDDVRRELEYWALKERGFVSIRIEAPEQERIDRLKVTGKFQNHEQLDGPWEHGLDAITADYTINNEDDFDEFTERLVQILNRERRRR